MLLFVFALVVAIALSLVLVLAVGWIVVFFLPVVVVLLVWGGIAYFRGSGRLSRPRGQPDLLGPGGADDPDR